MKYVPRFYKKPLNELLSNFPIVCILGARQCGKTTFIKETLPDWKYFDLEKPSHFAQIEEDPEGFLSRNQRHIILDEAQQLPKLFPVLRSHIDGQKIKKTGIVLLGSASPHLIKNISESLAGRVGFLDMSPFQEEEIKNGNLLWLSGGYPDAYLSKNEEQRISWFDGYTRTFIERDLNLYGINVDPQQMRKLWNMLAHVHGNIINASELGGSLGISYHTVNKYIDILEQVFLIRRLKPYYTNIGKRIVKRPKVYIRDSGLLHYFLNIFSEDDLHIHPKKGNSWEGYIIEQIINILNIKYSGLEYYFWMTATKQETDLLIKRGNNIVPVEIKLHSAPKISDVTGLVSCINDLNLKKGFVIHPEGAKYSLSDKIFVTDLKDFIIKIKP